MGLSEYRNVVRPLFCEKVESLKVESETGAVFISPIPAGGTRRGGCEWGDCPLSTRKNAKVWKRERDALASVYLHTPSAAIPARRDDLRGFQSRQAGIALRDCDKALIHSKLRDLATMCVKCPG